MEIPYRGNIKDLSLVKLLVQLHRIGVTGTLSLATSAWTKKIYINGGDVVFASSNYEDDRLGEILIKVGKITIEHYDRSVEVLKAWLTVGFRPVMVKLTAIILLTKSCCRS